MEVIREKTGSSFKLCDFGLARCLTEHHEIINPESTEILDPDKDDLSLLQPLPFE